MTNRNVTMQRRMRPAFLYRRAAQPTLAALCVWLACGVGSAQTTKPSNAHPAFAAAMDGQQKVLAELARLLQQEKAMLSDGAIQDALRSLLNDETQLATDLRALGLRLLGGSTNELSADDRATRDVMADRQAVYADRYRRLARAMDAKAGAKPDSVFVTLLRIAQDTELQPRLDRSGDSIRSTKLGLAVNDVNEIINSLRQMVDTLAQRPGEDSAKQTDAAGGLTLPSISVKGANQRLPQYGWRGAQLDVMGGLLAGLQRMEDLAKRQRKLALAAKERAPREQHADDLAKEQWTIRFLATEEASRMTLLGPQFGALVQQAVGSIDRAIPGLERGPLTDAVEPALQAADELQAAAARLRETWKDILARIKEYTQKAPLIFGETAGPPHGMSHEHYAELREAALKLLRATGALTQAIERETTLLEQTHATDDLPKLRPEQDAIATFVTEEVVPYDASTPMQLPTNGAEAPRSASARDLLASAIKQMGQASTSLDGKDRPTAEERERDSIEEMSDALEVMIKSLQRLLGQLTPPAVTEAEARPGGIVLDPSGGSGADGGWRFELPVRQQESARQAFRGTFPRQFDRSIKWYYEAIAGEKVPKTQP